MKLFDLIIKEYFSLVEYVRKKIPPTNGKIILIAKPFYSILDTNLYIKRNEKLKIYRQLNFIICNANGFTSVIYDKNTKKSTRKIIINYDTYLALKQLLETEYR